MKKAENDLKISRLCQLMNVPIASYYYRPIVKPETAQHLEALTVIHKENFQAYGRRRMKVALGDHGIQLGVFKIARLMREAGIIAKVPKKPHYYPSGKQLPNIPNQLNRQFNPGQVNTHWVGDITYIRNHGGWSYLATVLDLGSRAIVGYALSQTPDAHLARQALLNAIKTQQPNTFKLMFHSDQGVQYTADLFKKTLSIHGINQSMSRRGNCWDNSVQERFFRSLKSEYLNGLIFINHLSVVSAVEHYIRYYNNKRIHSAVGNMTPVQKKQMLLNVA
jgi:putative transposase